MRTLYKNHFAHGNDGSGAIPLSLSGEPANHLYSAEAALDFLNVVVIFGVLCAEFIEGKLPLLMLPPG